jgi:integrase
MARLPSFVTRVDTARGVRYEARINTGLSTGKRLQQRKRFASLEEAKAWRSTTIAALSAGTFTAPSDVTVKQAIEAWRPPPRRPVWGSGSR